MKLNLENLNDLTFCIAEVIEVTPFDTYNYIVTPPQNNNTSNLFTIYVKIDGHVHKPRVPAKPANTSIKKIPLVGELVLIFKTNSNVIPSANSNGYNQEQWYYLSTIDVNSSINHNSVPGWVENKIVSGSSDIKGKSFKEQSVSPLQPFEGDVLIEGRSGNSIRFGSTLGKPDDPNYYIKQSTTFTGTADGPYTIISNGRANKQGKEFVVEDINKDAASLWLTSTQRLDKFKLNYKPTLAASSNTYNKSQLIGSADRIVLTTKLDDIILDSKKGIEIHAPIIKFGSSDKKEGMLHSTAVVKLLQQIIQVIQTGFVDASGAISMPLSPMLQSNSTKNLLKQLTNNKILFDVYKK
jgi:hypothetical protein